MKPYKNPEWSIKLHTPHSICCREQVNLDLIIRCKQQMLVTFTMEHKRILAYVFIEANATLKRQTKSREFSQNLSAA